MFEKVQKNELVSMSKSRAIGYTGSWNNGQHGRTITVCKRSSPFYARIYDKLAQQLELEGFEEKIENWIRFELELKQDKPFVFLHKLINEKIPVGELFTGIVSNYIRFLNTGADSNKSRWETNEEWEKFLGDAEKIKLTNDLPEKIYTKEKLDKNLVKLKSLIYTIIMTTPKQELISILEPFSYCDENEVEIQSLQPKYRALIEKYAVSDNLIALNNYKYIEQLKADITYYYELACFYAPNGEVPF
jgi:phage replication initiation protein